MTDQRNHMSCEEFNACMAELIAAGEDIFAHPHVRQCKLHRAFLGDLEAIADAAKQMFPDVDPPEEVWDGIEAEIARQSQPVICDPLPGYRLVYSVRFVEHGSPPRLDRSRAKEKSSLRPSDLRRSPCISRREGRG